MKHIGRRSLALTQLIGVVLRDMVLGGLTTLRLILTPRPLQPRLVVLAYGDLPEGYAALLGAMLCITPGTSTVHIDIRRRELLLHVLDGGQADAALAAIARDFIPPLNILAGVRP